MNEEEIYSVSTTGRLLVKDNKKFIELLSGAPSSEHYQKVEIYGKKQLEKLASDIPMKDKEAIINMALFKSFQSFDVDAGANFLTYFSSKLRGEVSDYRNKRDSMLNKVHKMVNEERDSYKNVYNGEKEQNDLEKVTNDTPETIMMAEDIYRRKMQAFRMAYSGIPLYSQYILTRIISAKEKLELIALNEGMTVAEITKLRNFALSLILSRVLRSKHLDEEEKDEIKAEHGLI